MGLSALNYSVSISLGAIAVTSQQFGEELLLTLITNITCIGSEQSLLECNGISTTSSFTCSSERDDAGVVCQGIIN